jgi:hypothetical protein
MFKGALSAKIVNFCYPQKLSEMIDALIKRVSVTYKCYEMYATFSNISAISWRPVLVLEEAGVPGENHTSPYTYNIQYDMHYHYIISLQKINMKT